MIKELLLWTATNYPYTVALGIIALWMLCGDAVRWLRGRS